MLAMSFEPMSRGCTPEMIAVWRFTIADTKHKRQYTACLHCIIQHTALSLCTWKHSCVHNEHISPVCERVLHTKKHGQVLDVLEQLRRKSSSQSSVLSTIINVSKRGPFAQPTNSAQHGVLVVALHACEGTAAGNHCVIITQAATTEHGRE